MLLNMLRGRHSEKDVLKGPTHYPKKMEWSYDLRRNVDLIGRNLEMNMLIRNSGIPGQWGGLP